jgi:hypothetical protein
MYTYRCDTLDDDDTDGPYIHTATINNNVVCARARTKDRVHVVYNTNSTLRTYTRHIQMGRLNWKPGGGRVNLYVRKKMESVDQNNTFDHCTSPCTW